MMKGCWLINFSKYYNYYSITCLFNKSIILCRTGRLREAEDLLNYSIFYHPNVDIFYRCRGLLYRSVFLLFHRRLQNFDKSRKDYETFFHLNDMKGVCLKMKIVGKCKIHWREYKRGDIRPPIWSPNSSREAYGKEVVCE